MNAKMAKMLRRIERGDNKSKRLFNNLDGAAKGKLRQNVEEYERIKQQLDSQPSPDSEPQVVSDDV